MRLLILLLLFLLIFDFFFELFFQLDLFFRIRFSGRYGWFLYLSPDWRDSIFLMAFCHYIVIFSHISPHRHFRPIESIQLIQSIKATWLMQRLASNWQWGVSTRI